MKLKILYGICGLGNGHTFRQLPIIEHFSKTSELMIFAHDNSYSFYKDYFKDNPLVKIVEVAIPFYAGNKDGIDFKASSEHPFNQKDIFKINCSALDKANREMGKPDLVITDYESVSAQYAYSHNAPLITIDQQSKYLCGDFSEELGGFTFRDEIARLHMFFPKAEARIALSFFNFPLRPEAEKVNMFSPTLKESVIKIKRKPSKNSILVYTSSAREFSQPPEEIIRLCLEQKGFQFHIFLGSGELYDPGRFLGSNISLYEHGNPKFDEILRECVGIVSTAGHSLLSEAMYLGVPVYAIPVAPYEQHMNAYIIDKHGFGVSHPNINKEKLEYFLENIPIFRENIENDQEVIKRGIGQEEIIDFIQRKLDSQ